MAGRPPRQKAKNDARQQLWCIMPTVAPLTVLLFSKSNKMFFGHSDLENVFVDNGNKLFRGDLTGISATNEALATHPFANSRPPRFDFFSFQWHNGTK